jgi:lipid II:glycine glycyltransferase (peptidoglycan interpeptide bridge formation enzyme)
MPIIDIEENIMNLQMQIEKMSQELYRLQGMLKTFNQFKMGGLKIITLPDDPRQETNELESIQEKPE